MSEITILLHAVNHGDENAIDQLFQLLYKELRQIAHAKLRYSHGTNLLDTTSLVHESYLRLINLNQLQVNDRGHFLAYCARVMRSVIVDLVRESKAEQRGGNYQLITLDTHANNVHSNDDEILQVHDALLELENIDAQLVRIVEMKYFVGLEMTEIAHILGVGKRTVERQWETARSFLFASLKKE